MKRSSRKDFLRVLVDTHQIKPTTAQALIQCLDPFHDEAWDAVGLPSNGPARSVRRVVKVTKQIRNSTSDSTAPFDVHIFTNPEGVAFTNTSEMQDSITNIDTAGNCRAGITTGNDTYPIYPINIAISPSGADTTPANGASPLSLGVVMDGVGVNQFISGQSRIISSAFEVHNVTNELNVGGTVTTYRMPQGQYKQSIRFLLQSGASYANDAMNRYVTRMSRCPPAQVNEAILLADTKQWEAKWGCYCVDSYDFSDNGISNIEFVPHLFISGDYATVPDNSGTERVYGYGRGPSPTGSVTYPTMSKYVAHDTVGAFFTGLPASSQLTLTAVFVIESFPTQADPLVTLTSLTPDYDPMFFLLQKEVFRNLPPAVMVGENSNGEFWRKVLTTVKEFAPTVGSAFGPIGATLGQLAGAAAGIGANQIAKREEKKQAQPAKKPEQEAKQQAKVKPNPGSVQKSNQFTQKSPKRK